METFLHQCLNCLLQYKNITKIHYFSWKATSRSFQRILIDFFDYAALKYFSVTDSYFKWVQVMMVKSISATEIISKLQNMFYFVGLSTTMVSDYGSPFLSWEFANSCRSQGIHLMHSPPYYPESNGMTKRPVQDIKDLLKKKTMSSIF